MSHSLPSWLRGVWALATLVAFGGTALAAPAPSPVTPELVAAAKAEGKVVFYTSMDLEVAQGIGKAFESKYPGISAQVERSGAERNLQRVAQEYGSNIHMVDAVESSDPAHALYWKSQGWLAAYVPEGVAKLPAEARDAEGFYAVDRATTQPMAYNTKLVSATDAPKGYADLLDPKWTGKIVTSHPGYSGATMTTIIELSRALGWDYFQKLRGQKVMQVQSGTEPPKKVLLGERAIMFQGAEYVALLQKSRGGPIELIYPPEGAPLIVGSAGVMKEAPHPNGARLFISFLFSTEGQRFLVEKGYLRSLRPDIAPPAGAPSLASIKVLTVDAAEVEKASAEVKRRYAEYFGM